METQIWAVMLVLIGGLIGAFSPTFLKKGADLIDIRDIFSIIKNKNLILGVLFFVTGFAIFIPALKGGNLSVLYPLVGISYIWVCIIATIMLKEKMTSMKWLGILIIITGVALIPW